MVEVQVPETSARENTSEGNNSNGTDVLNMGVMQDMPYQMALPEVIEVILVENATLENEEMW